MERLPTTNVDITFRATQMEEVLARGPCHVSHFVPAPSPGRSAHKNGSPPRFPL